MFTEEMAQMWHRAEQAGPASRGPGCHTEASRLYAKDSEEPLMVFTEGRGQMCASVGGEGVAGGRGGRGTSERRPELSTRDPEWGDE